MVAAPDDSWVLVHRGDLRVVLHVGEGPAHVPLDGSVTQVLAAWDLVEATTRRG